MFCSSCGKEIQDGSSFCYHCGARQAGGSVPPPASQASIPVSQRRFQRSSTNVKIAGVCAGLAEYLDFDATVVRVLWVVLTIFSAGFPGILVYIILWVLMPVAPLPMPGPVPPSQTVGSQT